jgi:AraC-like DNA-binding protein
MSVPRERLPMTVGYFRLILRYFGDTDERRAGLLEGTGVTAELLHDPAADIGVFQQVRQIENASRIFGPGWAISRPELWNLPAHGALGVAVVSAPTVADSLHVLRRYGHVRSPWFRIAVRPVARTTRIAFGLTVPLEVEQWRPMMEIAFLAVRSMAGTVLGRPPIEMAYHFVGGEPSYAQRLRGVFGSRVEFGARENFISIPNAWRTITSAHADAPLLARATEELEDVLARLEFPTNFPAQVERLLRTMPTGRLGAAAAARALGVSRRTLARRLKEAKVSFRELLDLELKQRAQRMLVSGSMSRPDMAERLGYHDPTSFSRACRRWFSDSRKG